MTTKVDSTPKMVAALQADLERMEERVNALCNTLNYRASSSVSHATDHLRIAAHYLDYAITATEEATP